MQIIGNRRLPKGTEFGDYSIVSGKFVRGNNEIVDFAYDYWLSKHEGSHLPRRSDIKPNELVKHLEHLVILDVEGEPDAPSYKVRLIGSHVVNFYGEYTGKDVQEIDTTNAADRISIMCGLVLKEKQAQLSITPTKTPDGDQLRIYALYLPLYDAQDEIHKILVAIDVRADREGPKA